MAARFLRLALLAAGLLPGALPASATPEHTPAFTVCAKAECHAADSLARAHVSVGKEAVAYPALTYAALRGYRPLTLDLYVPRSRKGPLPVIVMIHGGGWIYGDPRHEGAFADLPKMLGQIAAQGFAVASVEYRFASEAPFPAALKDVKTAIRWLRYHSDEFGLDSKRFVTWGGSAGGQLSAMAATTCGVAKFEPDSGSAYGAVLGGPPASVSDCVQGAVAWYGAFDFTKPIGGPFPIAQHPYFGCKPEGCTREQLENPSAAHYLDPSDPPILLVHGAADASAPPAQSERFLALLKAQGIKARLVMIPGADHGFRAADDGATLKAHQTALTASLAFTREVIASGR